MVIARVLLCCFGSCCCRSCGFSFHLQHGLLLLLPITAYVAVRNEIHNILEAEAASQTETGSNWNVACADAATATTVYLHFSHSRLSDSGSALFRRALFRRSRCFGAHHCLVAIESTPCQGQGPRRKSARALTFFASAGGRSRRRVLSQNCVAQEMLVGFRNTTAGKPSPMR